MALSRRGFLLGVSALALCPVAPPAMDYSVLLVPRDIDLLREAVLCACFDGYAGIYNGVVIRYADMVADSMRLEA